MVKVSAKPGSSEMKPVPYDFVSTPAPTTSWKFFKNDYFKAILSIWFFSFANRSQTTRCPHPLRITMVSAGKTGKIRRHT
ncbi:MAG: hypothetical protein QNK37_04150 [Acidobacteriota bacterium]|nr:hypothetical protein [Acidobacteriota bacterium]